MTKWTKEQTDAIYKEGMPILVSAGAGSGKTAVLTERVIRKVKEGVSLNQLLILTFTKAAACEMKERIRANLQEENLLEAAEQVDSAYITTFDSFALSIVKKYHYLLNVPSSVSIVDASIIDLQKEKYLDQIFNQLYETKDQTFEYLITRFCTKDDQELKSDILNIHNKLNLKYDKIKYLTTYIEKEMQESHLFLELDQYMEVICNQLQELQEHIHTIETLDINYSEELIVVLKPLLESETYSEIKANVQVSLPKVPTNHESVKKIKEKLVEVLTEIKRLTRWETEKEILNNLYDTKVDIETMISILIKLEELLSTWKYENNAFEFHDIAKLAIRVIQENPSIQTELKKTYREILLDEYQDTSDLQETFINLIQNQNVYMVGDMKQSIYRFRNANPKLFKEKYDQYRNLQGGIKIDLIQNFRSRKEPLEDINLIFNPLLQEETGGADYKGEHQMVFGNQTYEEQKPAQDMHMCILTYEEKDDYKKEEIEAFLVAHDIEEKVNHHFQVMDPKTKKLRDVCYQDFVILMDRSTQFDLYRQIFAYKKIPLAVYKDETITSGTELRLIYHILKCMEKIEMKNFDTEWKYSFMSIMRSYLIEETDETIFDILNHNQYEKTILYTHIQNLLDKKNHLNNELLIQAIIEEFDFYQAFIKVGNIQNRIIKMEYLQKMAENLSKMGYDWYGMMKYLKEIADKEYEIRFNQNIEVENSVSIMTIHKSKGLEYPICYYTGLYAKFNKTDIKERMTYDDSVGFVIPIVQNGIQNTIRKDLLRYRYQKEEIAEKIRLFYVALTRCREQLIMIMPQVEEDCLENKQVKPCQAFHFGSFYDMVKAIYGNLEKYVSFICLDDMLSKEYKSHIVVNNQIKNIKDTLVVENIEVPSMTVIQKTFSKEMEKPMDYQQYKNIEFGKKFHQILEYLDFENPNDSDVSPFLQGKIRAFLSCPVFQEGIIHLYKEYAFYMEKGAEHFHGIIDLMIEYEDEIKIVDYKLKNLTDDEYRQQLQGYQSYIESITDKKVTTYLYSILDEKLESIQELAYH